MMDTGKIGSAMVLALEKLEALQKDGHIPENVEIGAAYVVVALDYPTPDDAEDRMLIPDVMTDIFVFGVPANVYIQEGVLRMGLENRYD